MMWPVCCVLVNVMTTFSPSDRVTVAVRPETESAPVMEVDQATPGSFSVMVNVPNVVIPENTKVLGVDEGEPRVSSSSSVNVPGVSPPVVVKLKSVGESGDAFLMMVMEPGKMMAEAEAERSWLPPPRALGEFGFVTSKNADTRMW